MLGLLPPLLLLVLLELGEGGAQLGLGVVPGNLDNVSRLDRTDHPQESQ
ncbi:hypothetical protein [Streptomyces spongiicola]|nr:hypothetical protein [Streptomyces spongiicola]